MRTRLKGLLATLALVVSPVMVQAQSATPESVRESFEGRFPGIEAKEVRSTPFPGLFEVQVGMDLLYTNATAAYVLQGALIDAKSRRDLTAERLAELSTVRSQERRVGKECVSMCRSRWSPYQKKKKKY